MRVAVAGDELGVRVGVARQQATQAKRGPQALLRQTAAGKEGGEVGRRENDVSVVVEALHSNVWSAGNAEP